VKFELSNLRDSAVIRRQPQKRHKAGPGRRGWTWVKHGLAFLPLFYLAAAAAAEATPATAAEGAWQRVVAARAEQRDIISRQSGYTYRIFVEAPATPPPPGGYPVLYVLDGNAAFPLAVYLARGVARRSQVTGRDAPLVVGIGYAAGEDFDMATRARDYTPPSPTPDKIIKGESGGADRFLDFIDGELKPLIAARYSVNPQRQALFGHSLGGLLVLHGLLSRPQSFSAYLASSPSLWWGGSVLLKGVPDFLQQSSAWSQRPKVQISVGELEDVLDKGKYSQEMLALLSQRRMLPNITDLAARLKARPEWQDRVSFHLLVGENHGSAWFSALARGMDFFLE